MIRRSTWSKQIFNDNRDFESVKIRGRLKLDLTFLIRRLRNRGKNGFEALDEMKRSVLLDFANSSPMMFEKQHIVPENSISQPGFAFFQSGASETAGKTDVKLSTSRIDMCAYILKYLAENVFEKTLFLRKIGLVGNPSVLFMV